MRLKQLNRLNYNQEVINKDGLVLVHFETLRSADCRAVSGALKEIAEASLPVSVATVNVDWNPQFAESHNASQVPTLILYKNGIEQNRMTGLHTKEDMLELIKTYA